MSATTPKPIWNVHATLGEGPVWLGADNALWFVDIKQNRVHRYRPSDGERKSWSAPGQVCFVFPAERGGYVAGLPDGLFHFDPDSGRFDLIAEVERNLGGNRLNDGAVDPKGRLWFGTMDNSEGAKSGQFYCFEKGKVHPIGIADIAITNGPAVSPDGKTLYLVDTLAKIIDQVEIRDDGSIGPRRRFVTIEDGAGHPDGPSVDSEGHVWIGLYGGWAARRYSPAGALVDTVRFPVANITKVALGGDDLRTAFATTANQKMPAAELAAQPLAGDLFEFHVDVPGLPCPRVRY